VAIIAGYTKRNPTKCLSAITGIKVTRSEGRKKVTNKNKIALDGLCKIQNKMEKLNTIATLTGTLDALSRADEKEAVKVVVAKILELVKQL
jgi:hypothetical protein